MLQPHVGRVGRQPLRLLVGGERLGHRALDRSSLARLKLIDAAADLRLPTERAEEGIDRLRHLRETSKPAGGRNDRERGNKPLHTQQDISRARRFTRPPGRLYNDALSVKLPKIMG